MFSDSYICLWTFYVRFTYSYQWSYFWTYLYYNCLQIIDVCWCSFLDLNFQKSPQVSNWIQIRGQTWPLQNFIFRQQPLLRRFSCMLGIIILLENVISSRLSREDIKFSCKICWYFWAFYRLLKIFCPHLLLKNIPKSLYCHRQIWQLVPCSLVSRLPWRTCSFLFSVVLRLLNLAIYELIVVKWIFRLLEIFL